MKKIKLFLKESILLMITIAVPLAVLLGTAFLSFTLLEFSLGDIDTVVVSGKINQYLFFLPAAGAFFITLYLLEKTKWSYEVYGFDDIFAEDEEDIDSPGVDGEESGVENISEVGGGAGEKRSKIEGFFIRRLEKWAEKLPDELPEKSFSERHPNAKKIFLVGYVAVTMAVLFYNTFTYDTSSLHGFSKHSLLNTQGTAYGYEDISHVNVRVKGFKKDRMIYEIVFRDNQSIEILDGMLLVGEEESDTFEEQVQIDSKIKKLGIEKRVDTEGLDKAVKHLDPVYKARIRCLFSQANEG